jgi:hypothetical protein
MLGGSGSPSGVRKSSSPPTALFSFGLKCRSRPASKAQPSITETGKRIPGLKLDHSRQLALMNVLPAAIDDLDTLIKAVGLKAV